MRTMFLVPAQPVFIFCAPDDVFGVRERRNKPTIDKSGIPTNMINMQMGAENIIADTTVNDKYCKTMKLNAVALTNKNARKRTRPR